LEALRPELLAKKVISQQEYDQARTNMDAQKATMQAAEANVLNLKVQQQATLGNHATS
jgi:multidrug resistance efflux pump